MKEIKLKEYASLNPPIRGSIVEIQKMAMDYVNAKVSIPL